MVTIKKTKVKSYKKKYEKKSPVTIRKTEVKKPKAKRDVDVLEIAKGAKMSPELAAKIYGKDIPKDVKITEKISRITPVTPTAPARTRAEAVAEASALTTKTGEMHYVTKEGVIQTKAEHEARIAKVVEKEIDIRKGKTPISLKKYEELRKKGVRVSDVGELRSVVRGIKDPVVRKRLEQKTLGAYPEKVLVEEKILPAADIPAPVSERVIPPGRFDPTIHTHRRDYEYDPFATLASGYAVSRPDKKMTAQQERTLSTMLATAKERKGDYRINGVQRTVEIETYQPEITGPYAADYQPPSEVDVEKFSLFKSWEESLRKANVRIGEFIPDVEKVDPYLSVIPKTPLGYAAGLVGIDTKEMRRGAYRATKEKPVSMALTVGAFAVPVAKGMQVGAALYKGSKIVKAAEAVPVLGVGVKVAPTVAGVGLGGVYGADVYRRTQVAERPWEEFGYIAGSEIIPMGVGASIGAKAFPVGGKVWGVGKKPSEMAVPKQLKIELPTTKPKKITDKLFAKIEKEVTFRQRKPVSKTEVKSKWEKELAAKERLAQPKPGDSPAALKRKGQQRKFIEEAKQSEQFKRDLIESQRLRDEPMFVGDVGVPTGKVPKFKKLTKTQTQKLTSREKELYKSELKAQPKPGDTPKVLRDKAKTREFIEKSKQSERLKQDLMLTEKLKYGQTFDVGPLKPLVRKKVSRLSKTERAKLEKMTPREKELYLQEKATQPKPGDSPDTLRRKAFQRETIERVKHTEQFKQELITRDKLKYAEEPITKADPLLGLDIPAPSARKVSSIEDFLKVSPKRTKTLESYKYYQETYGIDPHVGLPMKKQLLLTGEIGAPTPKVPKILPKETKPVSLEESMSGYLKRAQDIERYKAATPKVKPKKPEERKTFKSITDSISRMFKEEGAEVTPTCLFPGRKVSSQDIARMTKFGKKPKVTEPAIPKAELQRLPPSKVGKKAPFKPAEAQRAKFAEIDVLKLELPPIAKKVPKIKPKARVRSPFITTPAAMGAISLFPEPRATKKVDKLALFETKPKIGVKPVIKAESIITTEQMFEIDPFKSISPAPPMLTLGGIGMQTEPAGQTATRVATQSRGWWIKPKGTRTMFPPPAGIVLPDIGRIGGKEVKKDKHGRLRRQYLIGSPEAALMGVSERLKYD